MKHISIFFDATFSSLQLGMFMLYLYGMTFNSPRPIDFFVILIMFPGVYLAIRTLRRLLERIMEKEAV